MKDPYLNAENSFKRLLKEYLQYGKLIVAVDHDDTVYDFHEKGYQYTKVINLIKECKELSFYIVLFTGCRKDKWEEIEGWWLENIGFKPDSINKNPIELPFGNDGKIYYNILLDDRAGLDSTYRQLKLLTEIAKENKIHE